MEPMQVPTPWAHAASIRFCISRPSSMQVQASSPCMTSARPSVAPARWPAKAPHFDSARSVSRLRTTTRSHGCVFLEEPVHRPVSRMSRSTSDGISRSENWRTARSDRIQSVWGTGPVYRSACPVLLVKAGVCREFGGPLVIENATSTRRNTARSESGWRPAASVRATPDLEKHSQCWYNGGVTLVVIGGPTEERVENAVRAFEAEGFRRASAIAEDLKQGNTVVPLRVGAAEILKQADDRGILYALVHHGPDDRIKNGTYARAHHRVEAPELTELARRLGANQKMLA